MILKCLFDFGLYFLINVNKTFTFVTEVEICRKTSLPYLAWQASCILNLKLNVFPKSFTFKLQKEKTSFRDIQHIQVIIKFITVKLQNKRIKFVYSVKASPSLAPFLITYSHFIKFSHDFPGIYKVILHHCHVFPCFCTR